tara:strand:- start:1326 stop:1613 length:288 start_codon:yes stop_codon:yes gene_type:complete
MQFTGFAKKSQTGLGVGRDCAWKLWLSLRIRPFTTFGRVGPSETMILSSNTKQLLMFELVPFLALHFTAITKSTKTPITPPKAAINWSMSPGFIF